jgi:hypothetical protein
MADCTFDVRIFRRAIRLDFSKVMIFEIVAAALFIAAAGIGEWQGLVLLLLASVSTAYALVRLTRHMRKVEWNAHFLVLPGDSLERLEIRCRLWSWFEKFALAFATLAFFMHLFSVNGMQHLGTLVLGPLAVATTFATLRRRTYESKLRRYHAAVSSLSRSSTPAGITK